MDKGNETHISVRIETKEKLKSIADNERRSMRTVITRLIDSEYNKGKK